MHILDQVFLRKKCGLYSENTNQCPVFSLFWGGVPFAIQLNTFTWNKAVTKLKYLPINIDLAIVATYVVFTQDMEKTTHTFHHKYTFTM